MDSQIRSIKELLENKFAENYPGTIVQVGSGFGDNIIHVRIISPHFEEMPRSKRDDEIWDILEELSEEDVLHISLCILLSPSEVPQFVFQVLCLSACGTHRQALCSSTLPLLGGAGVGTNRALLSPTHKHNDMPRGKGFSPTVNQPS